MFLSVITQACDQARRKFTRGEQAMLIDIFNGSLLTPGILGQHLIAQVEDSFALYPQVYEAKWGVTQTEMMDKTISLDPVAAAFVELWAVGFWALNTGAAGELEEYLSGKLNLGLYLSAAIEQLAEAGDRLEKTKGAFKSAAVAEAREQVERAREKVEALL